MTTQSNYPWRATARTAFAVLVALATLIPLVVSHLYADSSAVPAALAQAVVFAAAVTRLLATPAVEIFLQKFAPWLSAAPAAVLPTDAEQAALAAQAAAEVAVPAEAPAVDVVVAVPADVPAAPAEAPAAPAAASTDTPAAPTA